jgi:ATP-dependent RNA helicase DDX1
LAVIAFHWHLNFRECIPLILGGGDVMAASETGSGKTAAFAMPTIQLCIELLREAEQQSRSQSKQNRVHHALVEHDAESGDSHSSEHEHKLSFEMSPVDRDHSISMKPQSDGLLIQSRDKKTWAGCRCRAGVQNRRIPTNGMTGTVNGGRIFYFECTLRDEGGIVRIGVSTREASLDLGTDSYGYGFGSTGVKVHGNKFEAYGVGASDGHENQKEGFAKGDVIGCMIDYTKGNFGVIIFTKNGASLGKAFDIEDGSALFPTISMKNSECEMIFGSGSTATEANGCFKFHPNDSKTLVPIANATRNDYGVTNPNAAYVDVLDGTEGPFAIVIEPTRDLARQTYQVFSDLIPLKAPTQPVLSTALLIGGVNSKGTAEKLSKGKVDFLVGCPSIIASFITEGKLSTNRCFVLVLDEADQLASKGNIDHIDRILCRLPRAVQTCFFSATLNSRDVQNLAQRVCYQATVVDLVGADIVIPQSIVHCLVEVDVTVNSSTYFNIEDIVQESPLFCSDGVHSGGQLDAFTDWDVVSKEDRWSELIKQLKPRFLVLLLEKLEVDQILLFVRTNLDATLMERYLQNVSQAQNGSEARKSLFTCRVLAGKRSMVQRQEALQAFKEGTIRVLIATDVAARGIDVPRLPCLIQYTLPDTRETFIHRVGRVGRMGEQGIAVSMVAAKDTKEKVWYCRDGQQPPCADTRLFQDGGKQRTIIAPFFFSLCLSFADNNPPALVPPGNCKWYNEHSLYRSFQSAIGSPVMNIRPPDMTLPLKVERVLQGFKQQNLNAEKLGRNEVKSSKSSEDVKKLVSLQKQLQINYWALQQRFKRK